MSRVARRIAMTRLAEPSAAALVPAAAAAAALDAASGVAVDRADFDAAPRARAARHARALLRRMEPVVMLAPRWSSSGRFLDGLAQDLAVGAPAVACVVVDFRAPGAGAPGARSPVESWRQALHALAPLISGGRRRARPRTVADRRGFRWALDELLDEVHEQATHRTALLAHGCDALPVEILADLLDGWREYHGRHPDDPRCTALFAAADSSPWLGLGLRPPVPLADYGPDETIEAIVARVGPFPIQALERAAVFSGGVPALVDRLATLAQDQGALPTAPRALIEALGSVGDELRGAVEIVQAHEALAERMSGLLDGRPRPMVDAVDRALLSAGLLRLARSPDGVHVVLRAPAIGALFS